MRNQHFSLPSLSVLCLRGGTSQACQQISRQHTQTHTYIHTHTHTNTHTQTEETGSSANHAKQRACSSAQTKIAQRKQKAGHPYMQTHTHNRLSLPLSLTLTHTHTHTNTHTWTRLNKEIDCARPIRFPREGIPDFNGINLGTLARIIKNPVLWPLPRYHNNWRTTETPLQDYPACIWQSEMRHICLLKASVFIRSVWKHNKCVEEGNTSSGCVWVFICWFRTKKSFILMSNSALAWTLCCKCCITQVNTVY